MVGHDKGLKESIILINQCLYTQHELLKMVMLIWNVFISSPKEENKTFLCYQNPGLQGLPWLSLLRESPLYTVFHWHTWDEH